MLRKVALSLLKRHPGKGSIRNKRQQAGWDSDFLEEVLRGASTKWFFSLRLLISAPYRLQYPP
jgi:hypothetical protein